MLQNKLFSSCQNELQAMIMNVTTLRTRFLSIFGKIKILDKNCSVLNLSFSKHVWDLIYLHFFNLSFFLTQWISNENDLLASRVQFLLFDDFSLTEIHKFNVSLCVCVATALELPNYFKVNYHIRHILMTSPLSICHLLSDLCIVQLTFTIAWLGVG